MIGVNFLGLKTVSDCQNRYRYYRVTGDGGTGYGKYCTLYSVHMVQETQLLEIALGT